MIERTLFSADHEAFRDSFRRFMDKEIAPFHEDWEAHGYVDRALWTKAGENGFLCMSLPAPGSLIAMAPTISPLASLGRYCCFCAWVP